MKEVQCKVLCTDRMFKALNKGCIHQAYCKTFNAENVGKAEKAKAEAEGIV